MSAVRTERLLNLLTLLLNTRRPIPLSELREMEEFSAYLTADPKSGERTFERDKAELVELGVPVVWLSPNLDEDGESDGQGGYLIDRDKYFLPELRLQPQQVALLSIAGANALRMEHFPMRQAIIGAMAKLGFDVDGAGSAPTMAYSPLQAGIDPERISRNLETLQDAVARRVSVQLSYQGFGGAPTERAVDPYGLYYRQGAWYLVGHCHLRQSERTFHLGRMQEVTPARARTRRERGQADFRVPDDFDLSAHARLRPWEFPGEAPVEVVIRLAERLVPAIGELFGGRAQLLEQDGEHHVRLRVTNRGALISAVLPHGDAAEVLSPPELRQRLGDIYAELAQRYEQGGAQ